MINKCSICNYNIADPERTIGCNDCGEESAFACLNCYDVMVQNKAGTKNYWEMLDTVIENHKKNEHHPIDVV